MKVLQKIAMLSLACTVYLFAGSAPKEYPSGELGKLVKLGEEIAANTDTHPLSKDFVDNKLQCSSCHIKGEDGKPGTADGLSSWLDTAVSFPAWSKREKAVQTLEDRSNNCFMRSMNGIRLPNGSEASMAVAAYITWLSDGKPMHLNDKGPWGPTNKKLWPTGIKHFNPIQKQATHDNYLAGKKVYTQKCAMCHNTNGAGMGNFPPLWGKDAKGQWLSYNTGAGMSKLDKGAAWVKAKMPLYQEGSLTDQEAADVMLYVNAQERADFDLQKRLTPAQKAGDYHSNVLEIKHSVRGNYKALGLDIDVIRGDKLIK